MFGIAAAIGGTPNEPYLSRRRVTEAQPPEDRSRLQSSISFISRRSSGASTGPSS